MDVGAGYGGIVALSGERVDVLDVDAGVRNLARHLAERVSPATPYAFCREARSTWELFAENFARHGQGPDGHACNCGPFSAPGNPLLATTSPVP